MKILIVSKIPSNPVVEGNRWYIMTQVNTLRKLGHDVYFLYIGNRNDNELDRFWGDHYFFFKVHPVIRAINYIKSNIRKYLNDWYWKCDDAYPWGLTSFVNKINNTYNFEACIINYFYLSRLFKKVHIDKKAIFTHDRFTYKNLLLKKHSYLSLKPNEEAKALQRCQHIFAIQDNEAEFFRVLAPQNTIYTIYSEYPYHQQDIVNNKRILFLSGKNEANLRGISHFIKFVFVQAKKQIKDLELFIGGGICSVLNKDSMPEGVVLLGFIDKVEDFYRLGDVAINPVFEGTGLKIKTFESLSYDKILLVHPHSVEGIYNKNNAPLIVCHNDDEWVESIVSVFSNTSIIMNIKKEIKNYITELNNFVIDEYQRFFKQ